MWTALSLVRLNEWISSKTWSQSLAIHSQIDRISIILAASDLHDSLATILYLLTGQSIGQVHELWEWRWHLQLMRSKHMISMSFQRRCNDVVTTVFSNCVPTCCYFQHGGPHSMGLSDPNKYPQHMFLGVNEGKKKVSIIYPTRTCWYTL